MNRALNWTGQALLYGSFALVVGVFSRWPSYHPLAPNEAQIKVSFIHHGARIAECRPYTAEELAKLAPNMRAPMKCERERSPRSSYWAQKTKGLRFFRSPAGFPIFLF